MFKGGKSALEATQTTCREDEGVRECKRSRECRLSCPVLWRLLLQMREEREREGALTRGKCRIRDTSMRGDCEEVREAGAAGGRSRRGDHCSLHREYVSEFGQMIDELRSLIL